MEESSVQVAVQRFDGQLFGGSQLEVSVPISSVFHTVVQCLLDFQVNVPRGRSRGDSYSSQRSHTSNRTVIGPRDIQQGSTFSRYNHHTRNFSRNSVDAPHHVRNFSRQSNDALVSPPRIESRLMSSVSEVIQHNAALSRMGPLPLESIENTYGRNQQTKLNYECRHSGDSFSQNGQSNRKENSPMKSDKPPMTPSRQSSFSSQAGAQGSKRKQGKRAKVSRQNS
jgi:hypothetical protein